MQLTFLGRPEIWVDGRLLAQRLPLKGMALLAYLAATGRPVTREVLAGLLWGETPDAAARASLRVTLNRLPAPLRPYLHLSRDTVGLHLDRVSADVQVLATAVTGAPTDWATAVALYRGDFLEGFSLPDAPAFEEWALLERERLRLLVIELLHRLADDALAQQAYTAGIAYARRSLALDNWREEAHRLLMRLLALDGRRSDALAQFESCRRLLAENLGVEPTAETVALYEAIKHNHLTALPTSTLLSAGPHPLTSSSLPPHNLPAIAASFVGREAELAQLTDLLAQADGRLLTILGPGGVGKTRLALETATRLLAADPHFADGVFFVPLADLPPDTSALNEAEAALAAHIANALGLALNGAAPLDEQLRQHLRDRRCLLILDNFEHLLPQAGLVAGLLAAAPGLRLLVTSRQRLNLYEEWLVELDGLELPPDLPSVSHSANEGAGLADWQNFSAPQLFIQRARRVYLGFNSAAEREAILYICRLVGGLPLALELAAAWVRTVPCRDIAAAIERHLDFLTGDLRNMPERQRSLRAAFAYSWELLPAAEQNILARLAVFRGGFDGQAALTITGEAATGRSLRQLSALVDKSLVQRQPDGRYRLHEVIRLFAQEQMDADEWAAVRTAHARYYAALLAAQGAKSAGPEAEAALRLMALELENGRFAWQWALTGEPTAAPLLAPLLAPLSLFYLRRGRSLEAAAWLEEAMPVVEPAAQASLAAQLAAQLAHQLAKHEEALGRYDAAQARLLACLPALEVADLTAQAADAWEMLGRTQRHLGDLAAAEASFQHSLGLHRLTGQQSSIAGVLNSLGVLAKNDGRHTEARTYYTESLDIFRRQGDRSGVAVCLINLGNIANVQGDYGRARACYQESYDLAVAAENRSQMAINLLNLGSVARATGDVAAAGRYYRESLALGREMGRALIVAAALDGLGLTQVLAGDLGAARVTLREGLKTAVDLNSTGMILTLLASTGRALAQPDGAHLLAFVWQQPGAPHHVREEAAAYAANAGLELAQPATDLDISQAVQLALAQLRDPLE